MEQHTTKTPTELLECMAAMTDRMQINQVDGGYCIDAETDSQWVVTCAESLVSAIQNAAQEMGIAVGAD